MVCLHLGAKITIGSNVSLLVVFKLGVLSVGMKRVVKVIINSSSTFILTYVVSSIALWIIHAGVVPSSVMRKCPLDMEQQPSCTSAAQPWDKSVLTHKKASQLLDHLHDLVWNHNFLRAEVTVSILKPKQLNQETT